MDAHVARYPSFWISASPVALSVRDNCTSSIFSSQFAGKLRQQLYPFRPMLPPLRSRPGRAANVSILPLLFLVIPLRGRMNVNDTSISNFSGETRSQMTRTDRSSPRRSRRQHRLPLLQQPLSFHVVRRGFCICTHFCSAALTSPSVLSAFPRSSSTTVLCRSF